MKPFYERDGITIWNCDCREVLPTLSPGSVDLIATDPPYFKVKGDWWDNQWSDPQSFLSWVAGLCMEWRRVLSVRGSLYVFASPRMGWHVEGVVRSQFAVLGNIRWAKSDGWHKKADVSTLRAPFPASETIIFAEHEDSLASYLRDIRESSGHSRSEVARYCGVDSRLVMKWEEQSEFGQKSTISEDDFVSFSQKCDPQMPGLTCRDIFQRLRRPFNAQATENSTDIWTFQTVSPSESKHPCEKPLDLMEHIISLSSLDKSLVLDPFGGSMTTGVAAWNLGRRCILCEISEEYCELGAKRLDRTISQGRLFRPEPVKETQRSMFGDDP